MAAIKMEVERSTPPISGFLEGVRELCTKNGIVLIFDECTSGFRETFGGLHLKYEVFPDMAIFGKALVMAMLLPLSLGNKKLWKQLKRHLLVVHSGLSVLVLRQR